MCSWRRTVILIARASGNARAAAAALEAAMAAAQAGRDAKDMPVGEAVAAAAAAAEGEEAAVPEQPMKAPKNFGWKATAETRGIGVLAAERKAKGWACILTRLQATKSEVEPMVAAPDVLLPAVAVEAAAGSTLVH